MVTMYAGQTLGKYYLNMVSSGASLRERRETVRKIMLNLHKTVVEVISRGYVNNDIKEDNICVCQNTGKVTLIDFGLATKVGEAMNTSMFAENHFWFAPEVRQGKPCTEASEVFSLGALWNTFPKTIFSKKVNEWI
ncbi:hypothetical protein OTU49_011423 [Cherax quadricarinatus]|uniref:Protein kinase domain-containing protein n=1 Tax=Cherax quadricarinatus TaxID=27406 RepID=A0AAW0Y555_CHEQU